MAYSDKVIDHYENPRNVGSFDKADESVGTGIGHHGEVERGLAAIHHAVVLGEEAAATAVQRALDALDRDIGTGACDGRHHCQHVHHAGGIQRTAEALVEARMAHAGAAADVEFLLRDALDLEFALGLHGNVLGGGSGA